jgi:hypothetical protein
LKIHSIPVANAYTVSVSNASQFMGLEECKALTSLDLMFANIGSSGAQYIASSLKHHSRLTSLRLGLYCNDLGDEGVRYLAQLHTMPALTELEMDLNYTLMGDEGVRSLSLLGRSPRLQKLTLHLSENDISDAGALLLRSLHRAPALTQLELDLPSTFGSGRAAINDETIWHLCSSNRSNLQCVIYKRDFLRHPTARALDRIQSVSNSQQVAPPSDTPSQEQVGQHPPQRPCLTTGTRLSALLANHLLQRIESIEALAAPSPHTMEDEVLYSHLWVPPPDEPKDFAYHFNLRTVRDEVTVLHSRENQSLHPQLSPLNEPTPR